MHYAAGAAQPPLPYLRNDPSLSQYVRDRCCTSPFKHDCVCPYCIHSDGALYTRRSLRQNFHGRQGVWVCQNWHRAVQAEAVIMVHGSGHGGGIELVVGVV